MDKKQGFLAITVFSFTLLVLTLPIWLDVAMPSILAYYSSLTTMVQNVPGLNVITSGVVDAINGNM